ncbi:hypothetical protein T484DRAFT_3600826 [Baffinella frigidus]|nr:hypothetical protein T484DRAFT_3600826 [Cryptophyta sp. CCMP2293]
MTKDAAANQVAAILGESGFFLIVDTEDPTIKTFALKPQPKECQHGVPIEQACSTCSRVRFLQACSYVLNRAGGKLTSTAFAAHWKATFPDQTELPLDKCHTVIAAHLKQSGVFSVEETGDGDEKMFSIKTDEELLELQKTLLANQQADAAAAVAAGDAVAAVEGGEAGEAAPAAAAGETGENEVVLAGKEEAEEKFDAAPETELQGGA